MTEYTFGNPEIIEITTDILIIGGGMAACGAAYEARRWAPDAKITLVDKAALDRSGAVAMGLSAINTYLGPDRDPKDYCRMVSADLMGITRDDLVYDVGRHVDDSVHLFEEWGLPIWKDKGSEGVALKDGGKPVRSGKWQIMINGEGYKTIVAEAAKKALGIENIIERCFIVKMLLDENEPNRIAGAVGFSVREHKLYVFKANAIMDVCGGAVNLFRPRSTGEGNGRTWYPVWNAGSTYAMAAEVGAELTMMENRFVPARFKDGYGPVGAWFLLFKSQALNAFGENYVTKNAAMLAEFAPYDKATVVPTCLRNHAMLKEMKDGNGPIFMDTPTAMKKLAETMTPAEIKHLEAEAWEDFLDMCIGQAGVWAGMNIRPEQNMSELMPTEPYLLGSHSGCCGIWVSGPEDLNSPAEWKWGYNRMTTVKGLFTAGDGVGASGHKFSSGSHAEGRICGKSMVKWVRDNAGFKPSLKGDIKAITEEIYKPVRTYIEHKDKTTAEDVNPHYILPRYLQMRLQKLMDEYVAGTSTYYTTNKVMLETGLHLLTMLKEDSQKMRAKDLHELMRAWENYHRIVAAEAHLRHIMFREETRYPGFFYRADFPKLDEANWKCFVNSKIDPATGEWSLRKVAHTDMVEKHYAGQGH
ncbi:adenylyl-sulfate reductase subunit alpha [Magnetospirillum moscoviense]|uniref:Adenylylsulfate reductase subunit alpha n=1 Tax=Magnetospirillum moscoviense TaxID=1437059 RepID=A0A178MIP5_9PROT|nr:adenylyl-sulfate reductase subunit alpha [Magnetospirillum moscoviense]MBF0325212.1 adenylyl-sulfate reductase subunit alpha [Alphaproteobacteria bacterium]OAN47935.1 adenylylsulfate reductase subunit alpha [Magnetospirillum moscoviense]